MWGKAYNECPGQTFQPLKEPVASGAQKTKIEVLQKTESIPSINEPESLMLPSIKEKALAQYDVQLATMTEIKKYQNLRVDVEDPKTVKDVKKAKQVVRSLRLKIQRRQKDLNADLNKKKKIIKTNAASLTSEIKITEDHLSAEIKKHEVHLAELAKEAKIKEEARIKKLNGNMGILVEHCQAGLVYGLTAEQIEKNLENLETTAIPKDVFQEKYQEACNLLEHAIESVKKKFQERETWETAEAARIKEEARLLKLKAVNDQIAWFNDVFGWNGTPEGMEEGLEHLESMEVPEHLKETVDQQKIQAQNIIVKARAAKAEQDRLAQEESDRKYLADWDEAIAFNNSIPVECELPEHLEEVADEKEETQTERLEEAEVVSEEAQPETKKTKSTIEQPSELTNSFIQNHIIDTKKHLANLNEIIDGGCADSFILTLGSDASSPAPIMTIYDGLVDALDFIKEKLIARLEMLNNEL